MSLEIYVFLADAKVPDRSAWMAAIKELGFPIVLYPEFDFRTQTGFLPAKYLDREAGFEFYFGPAAETVADYPEVAERIGDRDVCAEFRWGSNLDECATAMTAAAALAHLADGIYYFPTDDVIYDAATAVPVVREELTQF